MAVMSWIFLYFHPLSKQWGGQPGLPSVPSSTAAAASSKMRLNCDSSLGFAIPNHYSPPPPFYLDYKSIRNKVSKGTWVIEITDFKFEIRYGLQVSKAVWSMQ